MRRLRGFAMSALLGTRDEKRVELAAFRAPVARLHPSNFGTSIALFFCALYAHESKQCLEMPNNGEQDQHEGGEVQESETAENYEYSAKIMRRLLQSVGMWPFASATYPGFLRSFVIAAMCFLLTFFMIPVGLQSFMIVKHFKDFGECLDWLSHDWRATKRRMENDLVLASASTGVTFTTLCASFMRVSGMSYSALFSSMQQRTLVNNVSLEAFAYPGHYVFFDPYDRFYTIYALQSMCGFAAFTTTAAVASIAIAFTMHVCGQIAVVSRMLHNLAGGGFDRDTFRYTIEKHLRALRLAKKLEDLLCGICLVEVLGCCFNICFLGYFIITEFDVHNPGPYTYFLLIVSFTFNIFTFCYVGEQLSAKVYAAILEISFIMSTMRTFSNVLKAALSYVNLLRTVTSY